nr:immunoglobulin light chain junction region [Macaca mulatta]MOW51624.1 immunoglobulin light chain junction region [Macaca mulatta]MOW51843.1 immunoglobulin light chain junction region [Macaca mulatta]MOW52149.1 immunoglobulin light chain junction region [Macaca mulatta]MOW52503.1 immunoglobulin light chain junction region [Macaca mulatta]
CLQYNRDPYTF